MGSALVELWLAGTERVSIQDDADVAEARRRIRERGERLGLPEKAIQTLAVVASELGQNQIRHAGGGVIGLRDVELEGVPGIEVVAADGGNGMDDPAEAFSGRARLEGPGLGMGAAGARRLSDALDVDVRRGEGTCVRARVHARPPLGTVEVGVFGRACPGEEVSGDGAVIVRSGGRLLAAVADGIGHGVEARDATLSALEAVVASSSEEPERIVGLANDAVARTRGVVLAVVVVDERRAAEIVSIGNVTVDVVADGTSWRAHGQVGYLGTGRPRRSVPVERRPFPHGALLFMATDGLRTAARAHGDPALLREQPIVIAQRLVEEHARDTDDALVLVAR